MEAAVLLGLIGTGYLVNKSNEEGQPQEVNINRQINFPNGDNIYNSEEIDKNEKMIQSKLESNYEEAQNKHSKLVNPLDPKRNLSFPQKDFKEGYDNLTYSNATGGYICQDDFLTNDQGVSVAPYFAGSGPNINFDDTRALSRTQGGEDFYQNKREVETMFCPQRNLGNVHGGNFRGDESSYNQSMYVTSERPFEQEIVGPIDIKSGFNGDVYRAIAEKRGVDNLRTANNPKLNFEGKILSGKSISKRGEEGEVFQHNPEKFYQNSPDRYFTTVGSVTERTLRPEQIIPDTNRMHFNKQEMGPAAPAVMNAGEERPSFKKSLKRQFGTDTVRNATVENPFVATDFHKQGYRALPNERDVTTLRTYDSNIKSEFSQQTMGLQDDLKSTKKQTTINSKNNGYVQNTLVNSTMGLQDNLKTTKKQTTINSKNNGYMSNLGFENRTSGYESPETTTKDTNLYDYTGNAGGYVKGDMLQGNYKNAETNPTKEIIAQGRAPTINNVKIANGMDQMNITIDKLEVDYMNHRLNGVDKVYQEIPTDNNCEITTMKDRLEDMSIADRIDPELLNPFRQNPYTQPLESFSY